MLRSYRFLTAIMGMLAAFSAAALSILPFTTAEHLDRSAAVLRGTVLKVQSSFDPAEGAIYPQAGIAVDEVFKGFCPAIVMVVEHGGNVGKLAQADSRSPFLRVGDERVFFLARRGDGTLFASHGDAGAVRVQRAGSRSVSGTRRTEFIPEHQHLLDELRVLSQNATRGEDITDQAALLTPTAQRPTGPIGGVALSGSSLTYSNLLLADTNGPNSRFVIPDRGEPIPYVVDAQFLWNGMTSNQVLSNVQVALNAWTSVTRLKFLFEGWSNFGNAASSIFNLDGTLRTDGRLRLQVHDTYNFITTNGVLGRGGFWANTELAQGAWGAGGRIGTNEICRTFTGFVVLEGTNRFFQTNAVFQEVLCHEIGHALGLAHSTQSAQATNSPLFQSMMYYLMPHGDNRGATLGVIDGPDIRQLYPTNKTPPFTYPRYMDIVTASANKLPTNAGVNQIQLRGYDLQNAPLTAAIYQPYASNGLFNLTGLNLKFTPFDAISKYYIFPGDTANGTNAPWDQTFVRFSDGTNASAWETVNVISMQPDSRPGGGSDGLPDGWMTGSFGTNDPSAGPNRGPNDDFDKDGFTNLQEFLAGTAPTDPMSNLRILAAGTKFVTCLARAFDLY